jgi:hypothetical protein
MVGQGILPPEVITGGLPEVDNLSARFRCFTDGSSSKNNPLMELPAPQIVGIPYRRLYPNKEAAVCQ